MMLPEGLVMPELCAPRSIRFLGECSDARNLLSSLADELLDPNDTSDFGIMMNGVAMAIREVLTKA